MRQKIVPVNSALPQAYNIHVWNLLAVNKSDSMLWATVQNEVQIWIAQWIWRRTETALGYQTGEQVGSSDEKISS
jgi:hypothetical protein